MTAARRRESAVAVGEITSPEPLAGLNWPNDLKPELFEPECSTMIALRRDVSRLSPAPVGRDGPREAGPRNRRRHRPRADAAAASGPMLAPVSARSPSNSGRCSVSISRAYSLGVV